MFDCLKHELGNCNHKVHQVFLRVILTFSKSDVGLFKTRFLACRSRACMGGPS